MNSKNHPQFQVTTFPKNRISTFDIGVMSKEKHCIPALLEVDVTNLRKRVKLQKSKGIRTSFTAELLVIIAQSLSEHPQIAAYLLNKQQTAMFNSIDITVVVEKAVENSRIPIPYVIHKANTKTGTEIAQEIAEARKSPLESTERAYLKKREWLEKVYYMLPGFLRRTLWKIVFRKPETLFETMGNAVFTSVATVGNINGWFVHTSIHPVSFGVSAITQKPVVRNKEIVIRDIMNVTITMDHDVVDGIPMAKFIRTLVKKIETTSSTAS